MSGKVLRSWFIWMQIERRIIRKIKLLIEEEYDFIYSVSLRYVKTAWVLKTISIASFPSFGNMNLFVIH